MLVDVAKKLLRQPSPLLAFRLALWLCAYAANTIDDIAMEGIMESSKLTLNIVH
jgi:hypothetical protein